MIPASIPFEEPWKAIHVVAVGRRHEHALIKSPVFSSQIRHLLIDSWAKIVEDLQDSAPEFAMEAYHACQLIDLKRGRKIIEKTDPMMLRFLRDPRHPFIRLCLEMSIDLFTLDHRYHPHHNGG
jgi:hypothetical protein